MRRKCVIAAMAAAAVLGGCAAADPTGGAFGKPAEFGPDSVAENTSSRSSCPAGEMPICELKSPNRVSDGRYGFRKDSKKLCTCQPESQLRNMSQATLPRDNR